MTITKKELAALQHWQLIHGRFWRTALWLAWQDGNYGALPCDHEARLQGLRNAHGPHWLNTFRLASR